MLSRDHPALKAINERRDTSPDGPYHYHVAKPAKQSILIRVEDDIVARSDRAIILKEVARSVYDPVYYIPREDVDMSHLIPIEGKITKCPIKGEARHWNYQNGDLFLEGLAWSYESPLPYSEIIAGHIAFTARLVTMVLSPLQTT